MALLYAFYRTLKRGVLVVPVSTLLQRLAPPEWVAGNVLDLNDPAEDEANISMTVI